MSTNTSRAWPWLATCMLKRAIEFSDVSEAARNVYGLNSLPPPRYRPTSPCAIASTVKLLDSEMERVGEALGWLNIFNPFRPDGYYVLDLSRPDQKRVAAAIIELLQVPMDLRGDTLERAFSSSAFGSHTVSTPRFGEHCASHEVMCCALRSRWVHSCHWQISDQERLEVLGLFLNVGPEHLSSIPSFTNYHTYKRPAHQWLPIPLMVR